MGGNCLDLKNGAAAGCASDNWSAQYAKKLNDAEALARSNMDSDLQEQITQNKTAIEQEVSDRKTAISNAITAEISRREESISAAKSEVLQNANLYTDESIEEAAQVAKEERERIENDVIARLTNKVTAVETAITQEVSDRKTAISAVETALVDRILKQETYLTSPTCIGTWIDGTPIWRMAFVVSLATDDVAWTDKVWTPTLPISDINKVFVINRQAALYQGAPCVVDDYLCEPELGAGTNWIIPEVPAVFDGIYGWIEFVTAESNLVNE